MIEAAVVGSGLSSLYIVWQLLQLNYRVHWIQEPRPLNDAFDRRILALTPKVWSSLGSPLQSWTYSGIHITDLRSQRRMYANAHEADVDCLGHLLDAHSLYQHLLNQLGPQDNLYVSSSQDLRCARFQLSVYTENLKLYTHHRQHVTLHLSKGDIIDVQMVCVAGGGAHTWMHQQLQTEAWVHDYHQTAYVGHLTFDRPHGGAIWQGFAEDESLAFLPMKNSHEVSMVWSVPHERRAACVTEEDIWLRTEGRWGMCRSLDSIAYVPLKAHRMDRAVYGRVVFLGDAAQSIHPFFGGGFNDAVYSMNMFLKYLKQSDIEEALFSYQSWYIKRSYYLWTHRLHRWIHSDIRAQGLSFSMIHSVPWFKKYWIHRLRTQSWTDLC